MTNAVFSFKNGTLRIRIQGHAEFDADGHDIVCAAVSMLSFTLAECLSREYEGVMIDHLHMKGGDVAIDAHVLPEHDERVRCIVNVIRTGFEMLQNTYPTHVSVG